LPRLRVGPCPPLRSARSSASLAPCQSTNLNAVSAVKTARSWCDPATGKEPPVLIAVPHGSRRSCPCSPRPEAAAQNRPLPAACPGRAAAAAPVAVADRTDIRLVPRYWLGFSCPCCCDGFQPRRSSRRRSWPLFGP
jgi:hypothetical protein